MHLTSKLLDSANVRLNGRDMGRVRRQELEIRSEESGERSE